MNAKTTMYTRIDFNRKEEQAVREAAEKALGGVGLPVRTYCKRAVLKEAAKDIKRK